MDLHVDPDAIGGKDVRDIESSLQGLWEKARRISDLVIHLKSENQQLRTELAEMRAGENDLHQAVRSHEDDLKRAREELSKLQANGDSLFTHEEKEALAAKIRELIALIDSRL